MKRRDDKGTDAPKKKPRNPKFKRDGAEAKPSDRLRQDPLPGGDAATSGQAVPKLDKDGKRLKKSKLRMEKTGKKLDRAKEKLAAQKPYKPPGLAKTLTRALSYEAAAQAHKQVSKYERDNVGLEAAHSLEQGAEDALRTSIRYTKYRARTKPRRQAAKWERKHVKAQADHRLRELAQETPELKKNAFKRYLQKRRLKKEYQKKAKQAAKKGAVKAAEKTAVTTEKIAAATFRFIARHPTAAVVIIMVFLLVLILQSCMSGAITIGGGVGGAVGGTSYLAGDADINKADLRYTEWETDLHLAAKNAAATHVGYDEYRCNIGNIGHNPYELLAFLTAVYDGFTYDGIEAVLREVFNQQYTLTYTATTETRGSGANAYEWRILTTTLTARSFSDVIAPRITTQEQRERYGVYMFLHGNRQSVGNPFSFTWAQYVSSYYGYRVHPIGDAKDYHTGVDIAVPTGTEILAGGNGVVLEAGNGGNYGLTLLVDYGKGITARYAHCSALNVGAGQTVRLGDVIALVGSTGNSTGAHLHLEIIKDGEYLNPLYYVDGTQGGDSPVFGNPGAPLGDGSYAALIAEAERYIGMPYVFGGSTPSTSFDCSGFICWIFTRSGAYNLPRTTAQGIFNQCTPIGAEEAEPGDLVFFHSTYSTPDTVTHIGLYVGGGRMLHAGNPIGYTSINTTYWQQHFYSFGRLGF
jgi:murein DD-endopeptidase MepM/ murein hydrolase activator NlpD